MRRIVITGVVLLLALAGFYGAWPAYTGHVIRTAIKSGDAAALAAKVDYAEVRASLRPVVTAEVQRMIEDRRENGNALTRTIAKRMNGGFTRRLVLTAIDRIATPENTIRLARYGGTVRQFLRRAVTDEITRSGGLEAKEGSGGAEAGAALDARQIRRGVLDRILGRQPKREPGPAADAPKQDAPSPKTAGPAAQAAPGPEPQAAPAPAGNGAADPPPVQRKYTIANIKRLALTGPLTIEVGINRDPAQPWAELTAVLEFTGLDWKVVALRPSLDR